jgi:hypothetical protein
LACSVEATSVPADGTELRRWTADRDGGNRDFRAEFGRGRRPAVPDDGDDRGGDEEDVRRADDVAGDPRARLGRTLEPDIASSREANTRQSLSVGTPPYAQSSAHSLTTIQ